MQLLQKSSECRRAGEAAAQQQEAQLQRQKARLDREAGDVEARKRAMEQEEAAHAKAELALDGVVRTMNAAEASKLKDVEELRRMHQLAVRR